MLYGGLMLVAYSKIIYCCWYVLPVVGCIPRLLVGVKMFLQLASSACRTVGPYILHCLYCYWKDSTQLAMSRSFAQVKIAEANAFLRFTHFHSAARFLGSSLSPWSHWSLVLLPGHQHRLGPWAISVQLPGLYDGCCADGIWVKSPGYQATLMQLQTGIDPNYIWLFC